MNTLGDLCSLLAVKLGDIAMQRFKPLLLKDVINQGQLFVAENTFCLTQEYNFDVPIKSNVMTGDRYCWKELKDVPDDNANKIIFVESVHHRVDTNKYTYLYPLNMIELERYHKDWRQMRGSAPYYACVYDNILHLYPSDSSAAAKFTVKIFAVIRPAKLENDIDVVEIPSEYEHYILDYGVYLLTNQSENIEALRRLLSRRKLDNVLRLRRTIRLVSEI